MGCHSNAPSARHCWLETAAPASHQLRAGVTRPLCCSWLPDPNCSASLCDPPPIQPTPAHPSYPALASPPATCLPHSPPQQGRLLWVSEPRSAPCTVLLTHCTVITVPATCPLPLLTLFLSVCQVRGTPQALSRPMMRMALRSLAGTRTQGRCAHHAHWGRSLSVLDEKQVG